MRRRISLLVQITAGAPELPYGYGQHCFEFLGFCLKRPKFIWPNVIGDQ